MYKYFYREAEREEEEEDKVQIQKKDKQRERERVTQLGVRGDNGIITLIYNNIHPPPPGPSSKSNLVCTLFAKCCYKMSDRS